MKDFTHFHMWTDTEEASETLCSLEYRTMDKVQELRKPERFLHVNNYKRGYCETLWRCICQM
jgi:hypothetical protein